MTWPEPSRSAEQRARSSPLPPCGTRNSRSVGAFAAPGRDGAAAFHAAISASAGRGAHRIARPDGSVRDVEFEVRVDFLPGLHLGVFRDVTERTIAEAAREAALEAAHQAREAAERANRRHQRLAQRVTELLENLRRELARELHDEVGQELTALRMLLDTGAGRVGPGGAETVRQAAERVTELLRRVRDLSFSLRPPMLDDLGLVAAVLWNAERFCDATGVRVEFRQVGADRRFAPSVEVAAYRIVQEALTNVARHAGTTEARVRLWVRGGTLFVEVADGGRGFDAETLGERTSSAGIAGMRERAELLGGTVTIESAPGNGTVVSATLPVGPHA